MDALLVEKRSKHRLVVIIFSKRKDVCTSYPVFGCIDRSNSSVSGSSGTENTTLRFAYPYVPSPSRWVNFPS